MNICIFCGSSSGTNHNYIRAANELGVTLAQSNIGLIYGGARIGLMGAVADGALSAGGYVMGVIPQSIAQIEIAHEGLSELHIVESMHARKAMMADNADAFIALPGGIGTLEELFEVWTWTQLGIHQKSLGLLNVDQFYDQLLQFLDHLCTEGFVKSAHRQLLIADSDPAALIEGVLDARPVVVDKL